ncbi:pirin family protein [Naasia sp. SYSU D00948]|uniref:pirin family protein n=1 Tax=Naasia sp. SYSU D00948 TaxID=2817379 RepID=UPI001B30FB85|nr:pirin family protein [Naasia sp. SYSU D00948]
MTNLERDPALLDCDAVAAAARVEVLEPRDVPLGGPRAMSVRRTLPQRKRSLIGAWCFLDSYGPDDVSVSGGMRVPGHPHTGLQTVTWLFEGQIEHRDTLGTRRVIRPGEVNLMTAGYGIAHSEYSTPGTRRLQGAQLWVALPDARRSGARAFQNYTAPQFSIGDASVRVFLGELAGERSPVETWTPLLGAEVLLSAGGTVTLPTSVEFEHGVLIDEGTVAVDGVPGTRSQLLYRAPGATTLTLSAAEDARLLLLGGAPLGEPIVMWWNFVARTHEEIVEHRERWQAQIAAAEAGERDGPYGAFPDVWQKVLPAPELPTVRLRPREQGGHP